MSELAFFIDYARCIGCQACVQACEECDTHRGRSMIHLEAVGRAASPQTVPQVCMHCENPICARVCPADAIKQTPDGVTQSALTPRCIGCGNCVQACPFGVPKYEVAIDQMMKCDYCYDRTSAGKRPMCATVCPSQALSFITHEEFDRTRRGVAVNTFRFGREIVRTKVYVVLPAGTKQLDVRVVAPGPSATPPGATATGSDDVARLLEEVDADGR